MRTTRQTFWRLLQLVKPLRLKMCVAVLCGVIGFCCASFLTVLAGFAVLDLLADGTHYQAILVVLGVCAVLRGVFHYIEQYCNHDIAFRLLALLRDRVFAHLRKLAPAKLDSKDKGNLIAMITSDIELLEVFYAHTVSPVCIALITSTVAVVFTAQFYWLFGVIILLAHLCVGVLIPLLASKQSKQAGAHQREATGALNTYFLDSLRGMREVLQYRTMAARKENIQTLSKELEDANQSIKRAVAKTTSWTTGAILTFSSLMLVISVMLYLDGAVALDGVVIPTLMIFSSFGAVTSVANLGAGLAGTVASGNRVLDLLDESPVVEEQTDGVDVTFTGAALHAVEFGYGDQTILQDFSLEIQPNRILGITGKSGCGKSTTLKLLMRFWDVEQGKVCISGQDVKEINTNSLRTVQSFVTQETHLFHDSIAGNLRIAKADATDAELIQACKKASVHDFIMTLPQGYDTEVGELGDTLSGGERQRIGLARAFLHGAPFILLDEPTSNLDSLNEAVILQSLKTAKNQTILLVSHRQSTMKIADDILQMESGRLS